MRLTPRSACYFDGYCTTTMAELTPGTRVEVHPAVCLPIRVYGEWFGTVTATGLREASVKLDLWPLPLSFRPEVLRPLG
jgi:hypothetical protein